MCPDEPAPAPACPFAASSPRPGSAAATAAAAAAATTTTAAGPAQPTAQTVSGSTADERDSIEKELDRLPSWAFKTRDGWRSRLRHLTPAWFSVSMGTGVVAVLLWVQPHPGVAVTRYLVDPVTGLEHHSLVWNHYLALACFALNVALFAVIFAASALRLVLYPQIAALLLRHPVQSLFIGTLPMAFATIVNMLVLSCVPVWGPWARNFAWALWIVDAVVSLVCALSIPFIMMSIHPRSQLEDMTAVWLLPMVAPIVAASSGSLVASVLPNAQHALWTLVGSYVLWAIGLPLAFIILTIYFRRLTHHKLPPRELISSVCLPVGPFGQASFGIIRLGKVALTLFERTNTIPLAPLAGQFFYIFGVLAGLLLWAFGLVWLSFAAASLFRTIRVMPFNMGAWGCIFPIAVWVLASFALGEELPSRFFTVVGIIGTFVVIITWAVVFFLTTKNLIAGNILFSPCVAALETKAAALANTPRRQSSDPELGNRPAPEADLEAGKYGAAAGSGTDLHCPFSKEIDTRKPEEPDSIAVDTAKEK